MDQSIFFQLSGALAIVTGVAVLFRLLRQPLIISYIVTGFLVGPSTLDLIHNQEAFESFSHIGVALLLFIIGLGLNAGIIRSTGKPVITTFAVITLGLGSVGFATAKLLDFDTTESLVVAVALLFSSTIIVIKSLSDKKEQSRLYGQIAVGILLVEDIVATVALLGVAATAGSGTALSDLGVLLLKGAGLAALLIFMGAVVMPRLAKFFARSQELLYVFALAWAFGVASVFWKAGFSLEVGALFAGVAFAHLPYAQAMSTRLKPLRDFFIVLFFISLGESLHLDNITSALVPAAIFSAIIMLAKPLLTMISLGLLGYTKQTGFKAAVHLSQISEFSVVLIVLAQTTGVADTHLVVVMTLTAVITIALSAYLMAYDDQLYRRFRKALSIFERATTKREVGSIGSYPLILFGYHEGGYEFVRTFRDMKKRYVVVDYNPEVVETLEHRHINHLYGDATDGELLDEIGVHKAELVVSTITDAAANVAILNHLMRLNKKTIFVCHASSYDEAEKLYGRGAAYVILPHFVGMKQVNEFIRRNGNNREEFEKYRKKHLASIGEAALKA